jgi:hypothetical protein
MSNAGEKQLLDRILDGELYVVAEYRASHVGKREFVDKVDGKAKGKVTARHLVEISGARGLDAVTLFQSITETITDPSTVKIPWEKGKRYAFPLVTLGREKGKTSGLLDTSRDVISL